MNNKIEEHAKIVSEDMNNQAKDISRFVQMANDQEFTICRFFISWGIGSIAVVAGFYIHNFNINSPIISYLSWLKFSLIPLGLSIAAGVFHHLLFHDRLISKAKELDENNRNNIADIMEKGLAEFTNISKKY